VAARILGKLRARESVSALRTAAEAWKDIYVRAAAVESLLAIEGAETLRPWLEELTRTGSFNVRAIARRAFDGPGGSEARDLS
jgi:HEAT repeat protein